MTLREVFAHAMRNSDRQHAPTISSIDDARVSEDACILDDSHVSQDACILDDPRVSQGAFLDDSYVSQGAFLEDSHVSQGAFLEDSHVSQGAFLDDSHVSLGAFLDDSHVSLGAFLDDSHVSQGAFLDDSHVSQGACILEDSRALDLSRLFEKAFGFSRYRLPTIGDQEASSEQLACFTELCKRYNAGEPLQYILGEWEFYGLPFWVGPGVLIPRPDTETLVETGLNLLKGRTAPVFADLCAGSGCVAISLSQQMPNAVGYAVELSEDAFPYLERNIIRNGVKVTALQSDVLHPPALPLLDLIISNPPYLSKEDLCILDPLVQREPKMALDGGLDGYDFYRLLPALYYPLLKVGGAIAFEVGYQQAKQVAALLVHQGYLEVQIVNDLAGIQRVVYGKKESRKKNG